MQRVIHVGGLYNALSREQNPELMSVMTGPQAPVPGSDVVFSGFGKFSVSDRSAREGRNPATGEKIQIAASRVPKFTAGAALKKAVN